MAVKTNFTELGLTVIWQRPDRELTVMWPL